MPGIVGLLTKMPPERAQAELVRMVDALRHENFYSTGMWVDASLGVYIGWIERKGSFSERMPLRNERGDVALIFSGDEFSEAGTDLLHLSEADPTFPAGLNGRFHGLLADRSRGTATLFNDRYGMHRLSYHESKDAFYFAAEAKAILAVRPELRRADSRGLGELISVGCVLEDRTLFEGIHVLPCASRWIFRNGSAETKRAYFQPREWEDQAPLEPAEYYDEIRGVFSRNLPRYFESRERIAMSLTGGIDTRMIMAWQRPLPGALPCFTFGGSYRDCQDVVVARQVAHACEQSHEVIPVGPEFLSRFPHYAERTVYLTEGCVDLVHSPDLYLNERVREIAPIRMTGNYGDQVLRRFRAFKPGAFAPGLLRPDVLRYVRDAETTYAELLRGHPLSFAVFKQAPWYHHGLVALEETQLSMRSPYLDNDLVRTVFRAPESAVANNDVRLRLIADGNPALARIRTDRGVAGRRGPFLAAPSRALLEFSFRAEYAYDYGMPQRLARIDHRLSFLRLERLFLGRHKFHHFRVWYRDVLSDYVRDMLLDPRTLARPYLESREVEAVVEGHLRGDRNYTGEIHKMLTLELFHRLFIDP